jgi:hypothetical protein
MTEIADRIAAAKKKVQDLKEEVIAAKENKISGYSGIKDIAQGKGI